MKRGRKMNKEILDTDGYEVAFNYPDALERLVALKLLNFDLWYLVSREQSVEIFKQMKMNCNRMGLIPFARRGDNEDIACFETGNDEKVVVFKNCEYLGYRPREVFDSVWDWFRDAIEIMIAF